MKRPFGVSFLAFLWAIGGIAYIVMGLQMTTSVTFGPVPVGTGEWIWGWVVVLIGVLFWAAAGAAWSLQPWAWQLGVFLAAIGLLQAFFALLGAGNLAYALAITGWPLLLLWYLHREPVKKAFGISEE
jgi:hypothetical protein